MKSDGSVTFHVAEMVLDLEMKPSNLPTVRSTVEMMISELEMNEVPPPIQPSRLEMAVSDVPMVVLQLPKVTDALPKVVSPLPRVMDMTFSVVDLAPTVEGRWQGGFNWNFRDSTAYAAGSDSQTPNKGDGIWIDVRQSHSDC